MTKQELIFKERFIATCLDYAKMKNPNLSKNEVICKVSTLHRHSTTLQRLYTDNCNLGYDYERNVKIGCLENWSKQIVSDLGFEKLEINSDPRGLPFEFIAYDGKRYRFGW